MKLFLRLIFLIELSAVFSETGIHRRAIRVTPPVAVTLINGSTHFNCSTSSEAVEWHYTSKENLRPPIIYSYGTVKESYQARFTVETYANEIEKQFNLVLQSVTKDDSGLYICQDSDDGKEEGEVQLIVLETEPICKSNLNAEGLIGLNSCALKPETVQLSCSVRFSGHQFPELQWMKNDGNVAINSSICLASGNVYTCNLTMEAQLQMEGNSYTCQTTQSTTKQYNCTTDVVRILYAFGDDTELRRNINDKVNCFFYSSSQSCTSLWIFNNGTTNWTASPERFIELENPGRYICEATCVIKNNNCKFTAMTVIVAAASAKEPQGSTSDHNPVVAIVVPVVVAFFIAIIVVALIILFCRWNKKIKNGQRHSEQAQPMLPHYEVIDILRTIQPMTDENLNRRVRGLAILDDELFVTFKISDTIEIFPFNTEASARSSKVEDLSDPGTIAACTKNNCLYIMDQRMSIPKKKIFRINPDGTIINTWMTDKGDRGRISINQDGNVIMTVYDKNKVKIYSPEGGFLKTIDLSKGKFLRAIWLSKNTIEYICHAINLTDGNFILCHGMRDEESKVHRVCKLNRKGKVLQSFGNERGSDEAHLNSPVYLAERNDGSIIVADRDNHRIILLSSELEFMKELRTKENYIVSLPEAVCISEKSNPPRLFMGCNFPKESKSGGYVLDFKLSQSNE